MRGVPDASYDFVHSSHTLEHMRDAAEALCNWWRILAPGGYLIVVVPDWELYEQGVWPSQWNSDHKQRFSLSSSDAGVIRLQELVLCLDGVIPISFETLSQTILPQSGCVDYSGYPTMEPAIEMVLRRGLNI